MVRFLKTGRRALLLAVATLLSAAHTTAAGDYDPLRIVTTNHAAHVDLSVHDASRHRVIPVRIYLPQSTTPAPVVLFSHGLGGSRAGSPFLGEHWAARGYVAVFLQHPGSDDSVWKKAPPGAWMWVMKRAVSPKNFLLRVQDVHVVLDELEVWNSSKTSELAGRLDLARIGMSGHSFGATTTQAVSGETLPGSGKQFLDARIRAAVVMSPSTPKGFSAAKEFGDVEIPWMLMTGTKDLAPLGDVDMESRRAVYPALQGAPKYELVLHNAEHSAFTDRALPGDREPRNPNHHRVILGLSTAFWDSYLRKDAAALAWLNGPGPRSIMEPADQWQFSSR
jgi:predicted dienelactone hydrolase